MKEILEELKIPYTMQGVDYYVLGNGREIYQDGNTVYFWCKTTLVKKNIRQKTIKRIVRAYARGRRIECGEW